MNREEADQDVAGGSVCSHAEFDDAVVTVVSVELVASEVFTCHNANHLSTQQTTHSRQKMSLILVMFCTPLCRHHPQRRSTEIVNPVYSDTTQLNRTSS